MQRKSNTKTQLKILLRQTRLEKKNYELMQKNIWKFIKANINLSKPLNPHPQNLFYFKKVQAKCKKRKKKKQLGNQKSTKIAITSKNLYTQNELTERHKNNSWKLFLIKTRKTYKAKVPTSKSTKIVENRQIVIKKNYTQNELNVEKTHGSSFSNKTQLKIH